jgi:hypothetical protein
MDDAEKDEDHIRAAQARMLRALAGRLEGGDASLPTDVFGALSEELALRLDEEAIAAAWREQGEEEAEPWVIVRARIRR